MPTTSSSATPCRVVGVLDNAIYEVVVTGRKAKPVVGSKQVAALVEQNIGRTILATPAGPAHVVDPANIASIVALLSTATQVRRLEAAPDLGVRSPLDGVR